jgi:hypothetical protein
MSAGASERRGTLLEGREVAAAGGGLGASRWQPTAQPALSFTRSATPTLRAAAKGRVRGAPDVRDGPERPRVVMSANAVDRQT